MTHAEKTAARIIEYLRTHPDATQIQMQIALDFDFETWQNARAYMRGRIITERRNNKTTYRLMDVINGSN